MEEKKERRVLLERLWWPSLHYITEMFRHWLHCRAGKEAWIWRMMSSIANQKTWRLLQSGQLRRWNSCFSLKMSFLPAAFFPFIYFYVNMIKPILSHSATATVIRQNASAADLKVWAGYLNIQQRKKCLTNLITHKETTFNLSLLKEHKLF